MLRRLLTLSLLAAATLALPAVALAEDAPAPINPTPVTTQPAPDNANSGLGPSSATGTGGSNADSGALQPAGVSQVQNTQNSTAAGLTAPNAQTLQQPASADAALKVLAGETDGRISPDEANTDPTWTEWIIASLAIGSIPALIAFLRLRVRRTDQMAL